jgi:hypothetical protein
VKVDLGNEEFVYVRQMTGRERDQFEQSLVKEKKDADGKIVDYERSLEDFRAKLAVCTMCDEKGVAILKIGDYPILSQHMSARRLETIVNEAQKLNKISDKDKENLTKNSNPVQPDNSSSNSVEN